MATEITVVNSNRKLYINSDGSINTRKVADIILVDESSSTVTYIGFASPGTATSESYWRIMKVDSSSNPTQILYAGGDAGYKNVWNDRASLSYS